MIGDPSFVDIQARTRGAIDPYTIKDYVCGPCHLLRDAAPGRPVYWRANPIHVMMKAMLVRSPRISEPQDAAAIARTSGFRC